MTREKDYNNQCKIAMNKQKKTIQLIELVQSLQCFEHLETLSFSSKGKELQQSVEILFFSALVLLTHCLPFIK